ncbi:uncharacterized protein ARMOST_15375 [Armillaria ostoyae]|uniref:Uncharacterized protein n=1 Tax=Armillaria ostoyae TaxID=47428 RepID=A0A284RT58_ARMOS|nr:uncharacterized protein ARMOST_15375 [Armillaria ostoyae]
MKVVAHRNLACTIPQNAVAPIILYCIKQFRTLSSFDIRGLQLIRSSSIWCIGHGLDENYIAGAHSCK